MLPSIYIYKRNNNKRMEDRKMDTSADEKDHNLKRLSPSAVRLSADVTFVNTNAYVVSSRPRAMGVSMSV